MKTLYEILEVSETASKEIIEKAYKTLAKRYHPDLQSSNEKPKAEEMMKKINEAYATLSDDEKRKKYDEELAIKRQKEERNKASNNSYSQQQYYQQTNNDKQNSGNSNQPKANNVHANEQMTEEYRKKQEEIQRDMQQQYQERCQNAYENYLRSLGYRIKYRWTWKRVKELLKTCSIVLVIVLILWFFPPTHNIIMNFYESNRTIQLVVDIICGIFKGIWGAICSLFR